MTDGFSVSLGACDKNKKQTEELRHGIKKKKSVGPEPLAYEATQKRSECEANAQSRSHLSLHPSLALRRGLIEPDFSEGEGEHCLSQSKENPDPHEYRHRVEEKISNSARREADGCGGDEERARAEVCCHDAG